MSTLREYLETTDVILASSSEYRARELERVCRGDIRRVAVPDEVEAGMMRDILKNGPRELRIASDQRPHDAYRFAQAVAIKKVEWAQGLYPDYKGMIIAADTVAYTTRMRMTGEKYRGGIAEILTKPDNLLSAERNLTAAYSRMASGYEPEALAQARFMEPKAAQMLGRSRLITVETGIAAILPGMQQAHAYSHIVYLELGALVGGAEEYKGTERASKIRDLVIQALAITAKETGSVSKVAGGINYASPAIRELLEVGEVFWDHLPEAGVCLGLPRGSFEKFLSGVARDNQLITSV